MGFLRVFVSLLRHYRDYLLVPDDTDWSLQQPSASAIDRDRFLASFDKDRRVRHAPQTTPLITLVLNAFCWHIFRITRSQPFMAAFLDTTAFSFFAFERVVRAREDYEILFFDESIKAKLNRHKVRFTKEETPFLSVTHCFPPHPKHTHMKRRQ